jgi:acetylglutamate kinase
MQETLTIIKIGGQVLDSESKLALFLAQFVELPGKKILVHGGGKLATTLAEKMGVQQQMVEGRRITDSETLRIVTMVYAGYINKNLVALLNAQGCSSIGLCGADASLITAHKRQHPSIDFGWVGDIDSVNEQFVSNLLSQGLTPVIAPITADTSGQLLNTNADTIAASLATALCEKYSVQLVYAFERSGVMRNLQDANSVIPHIHFALYQQLLQEKIIANGMIPKLENAFATLTKGVKKVMIGDALRLSDMLQGVAGTTLTHE